MHEPIGSLPTWVSREYIRRVYGMDPALRLQRRGLRQCSGMIPEEVTLDLAGADEFSLACRSLPRTDP